MLTDSLVSPFGQLPRKICLFQGLGLLEGLCVQRCPKVAPSSFLHNSQLPLPTEVSLSILEPSCGELSFAYYLNPVALSLYGQEVSSTLGVHGQY
jgi:hypothetical protein